MTISSTRCAQWLIALLTLLMTSSVYADRRTALHGNMLIQDRDDTLVYPQLALRYNRTLSLDMGNTDGAGNALLIAGPDKKSAIGIALHRGDAIGALGNSYMGSPELGMLNNSNAQLTPVGQFTNAQPPIIADLIYARRLGKNKFGLRLGFVAQGESQTELASDDHSSTDSSFGFRLGAGYSLGNRGDFVLNAAYVGGGLTGGKDEDDVEDASNLMIGFSGRYYLGKKKNGFRMGTLFDLGFFSEDNTNYTADGDPQFNRTTINVMAGIGPVYSKPKQYKVALYGHLGLRSVSTEPNTENDDDESSQLAVMFPGFNVAMEYRVLDWLDLRGGASYSYILMGSGDRLNTPTPAYNVDKNSKSYSESDPFSWNAGFGIILERLQINGTFSHGFLTNGPQFVGGNNPGFLSMISFVGSFGGKTYRTPAKLAKNDEASAK